tara:strand:- start:802 stop:1011 length:210 start_codon:yes stop_codon:yes gene_type:complete
MKELEILIESSLKDETKQRLSLFRPTHTEQLLEDIRAMGRMAEAMNYIFQHHPRVFEESYEKVLKNDNR